MLAREHSTSCTKAVHEVMSEMIWLNGAVKHKRDSDRMDMHDIGTQCLVYRGRSIGHGRNAMACCCITMVDLGHYLTPSQQQESLR